MLAVLAIVLDAPTLLVAAVTAFGGAAYVVAGLYLILNQITVDQLKDGPIGALDGKPLALVAWVGLGAVAFAVPVHRHAADRVRDHRAQPYRFG